VEKDYSLDNDVVRNIYDDLYSKTITLVKARSRFEEHFRMSHKDPAIGKKLHELLEDHLFDDDGTVPLPLPLAFAPHLREGSGRKTGPITGVHAGELSALLMAKSMAAEYQRELKCTKGDSYYKAAKAVTEMGVHINRLEDNVLIAEWHRWTNLSIEQIVPRLERPSTYKLKKYFEDKDFLTPWTGTLPSEAYSAE
jgi:hypothetical protein